MCRNWYEFGLDLASGSQSPSFLLKVLPFEKHLEQCLAQRKCSLSVFFVFFFFFTSWLHHVACGIFVPNQE